VPGLSFGEFEFGDLDLFRISCLEFRILELTIIHNQFDARHRFRRSLLLYVGRDRFAGDQADASALVADRVVEHVVSFVPGIPDEGDLVSVLLVQAGWIAAALVQRLGVNRPMVKIA